MNRHTVIWPGGDPAEVRVLQCLVNEVCRSPEDAGDATTRLTVDQIAQKIVPSMGRSAIKQALRGLLDGAVILPVERRNGVGTTYRIGAWLCKRLHSLANAVEYCTDVVQAPAQHPSVRSDFGHSSVEDRSKIGHFSGSGDVLDTTSGTKDFHEQCPKSDRTVTDLRPKSDRTSEVLSRADKKRRAGGMAAEHVASKSSNGADSDGIVQAPAQRNDEDFGVVQLPPRRANTRAPYYNRPSSERSEEEGVVERSETTQRRGTKYRSAGGAGGSGGKRGPLDRLWADIEAAFTEHGHLVAAPRSVARLQEALDVCRGDESRLLVNARWAAEHWTRLSAKHGWQQPSPGFFAGFVAMIDTQRLAETSTTASTGSGAARPMTNPDADYDGWWADPHKKPNSA